MSAPSFHQPHIGTIGFDGPRGRTFATLGCVELQESFRGVPGEPFLRRLRQEAPETFGFVVRASCAITHADDPSLAKLSLTYLPAGQLPAHPFDTGEAGLAAWQWTLSVVRALQAEAIFVQTSASFRPTQDNRDRLTRFAESVGPEASVPVIWDSQGLWSAEEQHTLCARLSWLPSGDPLLQPLPPGNAYLRVLGRSRSPHGLSANDLDRLVAAHRERAVCWTMLHTPRAYRDARLLTRRIG